MDSQFIEIFRDHWKNRFPHFLYVDSRQTDIEKEVVQNMAELQYE